MKLLLISPPEEFMLPSNVPKIVDEETGLYPPLGLLYLAAYVIEHSSHEVEILDCSADGISHTQLPQVLQERSPDIIGIQTLTFTLIDALKCAMAAKQVLPQVPVVLGGPHTYIFPEETMAQPGVDYLIRGEGEQPLVALLNALERGYELAKVPGLVYRENGNITTNPLAELIRNLDSVPIPRREMLPVQRYYSVLAKETPITTMMSSRGCPYRCIFCDRPHLGKVFRSRSVPRLVDEMQRCSHLGIKEIFFYDDTFALNHQRIEGVCQEILRRKLEIGWDVRLRVDAVRPETLQLMRRAGCLRIHYGVEAGTPEIIKVLCKDIDLRVVEETFRATRKAGITTLAYFMLGNPTEECEQILRTIEFALRLHPDYVHFSLTTPFPGTQLYKLGLEQGLWKADYWQEFARAPQPGFTPQFWEEKLSQQELLELLITAYRRFYSRPTYILSQLVRLRNWGELRRKARAGWRLLFTGSSSEEA